MDFAEFEFIIKRSSTDEAVIDMFDHNMNYVLTGRRELDTTFESYEKTTSKDRTPQDMNAHHQNAQLQVHNQNGETMVHMGGYTYPIDTTISAGEELTEFGTQEHFERPLCGRFEDDKPESQKTSLMDISNNTVDRDDMLDAYNRISMCYDWMKKEPCELSEEPVSSFGNKMSSEVDVMHISQSQTVSSACTVVSCIACSDQKLKTSTFTQRNNQSVGLRRSSPTVSDQKPSFISQGPETAEPDYRNQCSPTLPNTMNGSGSQQYCMAPGNNYMPGSSVYPTISSPNPAKMETDERQKSNKTSRKIWEFLCDLLHDPHYNPALVRWEDRETGVFRLVKSRQIATIWGMQKGNESMNYEKFSRAMRYHYKRGALQPVLGKRLIYQFGPQATGWRQVASELKHTAFE
ncbi:uncharacterized protein LOC128230041 isoform X2 [Mya arenaria]|uniref:uncharacterized protein LOC128230041 isoform X2 n=1 Tax=Mya arenaria TaxID=6604 RepID=UPI0022E48A5A|nr:uncharacterized protein LOC128230041 isoform X2 [Mya arenaria]